MRGEPLVFDSINNNINTSIVYDACLINLSQSVSQPGCVNKCNEPRPVGVPTVTGNENINIQTIYRHLLINDKDTETDTDKDQCVN